MGVIGKAAWVSLAACWLAAAAVTAVLVTAPASAPVAATPAPKVRSDVYVLHDPVLVDLAGGGYATVTVGLEVRSGIDETDAQAGIVREIVTNDLTNIDRADLLARERREALKVKLARDIRKHTDVALDGVLLTDFTLR
jgi:flagellar basal body-associated protein FliL